MDNIQKNSAGSRNATIVISNQEINYVMKTVTSFEDPSFFIKVNKKTTENKAKG